MNRLSDMAKTNKLSGKRVIITGCGYKPLKEQFYDITTGETSHDSIMIGDEEMKLNIM